MTSPARIAANRRNAQKSTGPNTAEGKAAAAKNALRHGLTARQVVCYKEPESAYIAFHAAMRADLAPLGEVEEQLAERIILCSWRLRRLARAERGLIDSEFKTVLPFHESAVSRSFARQPQEMATLARYEAMLDRSLGRAFALLERRQAARRGEAVPAPVTVLVEGGASDTANPLAPLQKHENYETNPPLGLTPAPESR